MNELDNEENQEDKNTILTLGKLYPFIVKWGKMFQSYDYYIAMELERAKSMNAPFNATYFTEGTGWSTTDNITSEQTRKELGI